MLAFYLNGVPLLITRRIKGSVSRIEYRQAPVKNLLTLQNYWKKYLILDTRLILPIPVRREKSKTMCVLLVVTCD